MPYGKLHQWNKSASYIVQPRLKICFFIISEYALIIEKQYPFIFLFHTILQFKLDKAMLAFYLAFEI